MLIPLLATLVLGLMLPAQSLAATSVTSDYGSSIYIDSGSSSPTLHGAYVGYTVSSSTAQSDVWVTIGNFGGGVVSLAPNASSTVHVGPMTAGASTTVYFYVQAATATSTAQTHTITVYNGKPGAGGAQLTSVSESLTVGDTQQASANKVNSVSVSTTSPTLGGSFTITVQGSTGVTTGSSRVLYFSPEADVNFPAGSLQLTGIHIVFSQSGCPSTGYNCGTFDDTLSIPSASMPSTADTSYTATYTFHAIGTTSGTTAVSPVSYLTSGGPIKHTNTGSSSGYASLSPINPVSNTTTLGLSASPTAVNGTSRTVTMTATASDTGAAINLDDFVATLPTGASYVPGSSTFAGTAIADPNLSGQTATWAGVFAVPGSGTAALTFRVVEPAGNGAYTTSVVAHVVGDQIDTTTSTSDNAPASAAVDVFATAPTVTLTATPPALSSTADPSFAFTADSPSTFSCQLDGGSWTACTSPDGLSGLSDGSHTMAVQATDSVGNVGSAVSYTWTIDTTAPTVTITSGPGTLTTSPNAGFAFTTSETGTIECQLDSGAWTACSSPDTLTGLADGNHTFRVRDTDAAGNTGTDSYAFTVDTAPPLVTLDSTPADPGNAASGTIAFSADKAGTTYQCRLDSGAWTACTSPYGYGPLGDGPHTFLVQGTSPAGNVATPVSYTWTIDTTAPTVTITSGPSPHTTATGADITFASPDPSATFECRLDGGPWGPCASPASFTDLSPGAHTFAVRGTDPAGNTSAPVTSSWTISTPAIPPAPTPQAVVSTGVGTSPQTGRLSLPAGDTVTLLDSSGHATDTVQVAGQGTYLLDAATGTVTFVPVLGFSGHPAPVTYVLTDGYGQTGQATYTPSVTLPSPPAPPTLSSSGPAGATQTEAVSAPVGTAITLLSGGAPVQRIVIPGQGAYVLDLTQGTISFVPDAHFSGHAKPITYRITDAYGQSRDATYQAVVLSAPTPALGAAAVHVSSLVVLHHAHPAIVPVRCSLSAGALSACTVSLRAWLSGHAVEVGRGHAVARGQSRTLRVLVILNRLGRVLAGRLGGTPVRARGELSTAGQRLAGQARSRVVAARVAALDEVRFAPDSSALSASAGAELSRLHGRLGGARGLDCTGFYDSPVHDEDEELLAEQRAQAVCAALASGLGLPVHLHVATPARGDDSDNAAWVRGAGVSVSY